MWRRKSPSVMTPASLPLPSVTATQPNPLADISTIASHIRSDRRLKQVGSHVAPQIAIGDDAGEFAAAVGYGYAAKSLGRHFDDRLRHQIGPPPEAGRLACGAANRHR